MFCKAITSRGYPCIASCKADSTYCRHHSGRCVECPVCLEEVPHIRRFPCGHHLCVECLHSLTSDSCPMCRRVGVRQCGDDIRPLRDLVTSFYPSREWLPEYIEHIGCDVESTRLALLDLAAFFSSLSGPCFFESRETRRVRYIATMTRLVDFSCRFHVIAFRDPRFLDYVFDAEGGLPYTDHYPCVRRFIRCLDSFRHRVGGLPAFDRSRSSPEWLDHIGE